MNNSNNLHSKIKPYFPACAKLFSKHFYQNFLKNRPKYIQKLQFERFISGDEELKDFKAIGIHIKRLTQSTKSIQHADLVQFPQQSIPRDVHKDIIKRFLRIKKLSHILHQNDSKSIYISYFSLQRLKNLQSLILDESSFYFPDGTQDIERITSKFFEFLQGIKLQELKYKLEDLYIPLQNIANFPLYPSSLLSFSLSCGDYPNDFQSIDNPHELLNLKHLQNLKKFQMLTPLSLALFNQMLEKTPQQIQTLAFYIKNMAFKFANVDYSLPETTARLMLAKFHNLEHLTMTLTSWIDVFSLSEYSSPFRLKSLGINIQIHETDRESFMKLKEFIGQHETSLESLNLKIRFRARNAPDSFIEKNSALLEVISRLKKLKVLNVASTAFMIGRAAPENFATKEDEMDPLPLLPVLIHGINQLNDLRELRINTGDASFRRDFEGFFGAIQKKSSSLEVLDVALNGYGIKKKDLGVLGKTLAQLKFLEVLKLEDFCIDDTEFFEIFAETIHRCPRLRSLEILNYSVKACSTPQDVLKMFERIFQKSNLTHISFVENSEKAMNYDSCEKFRIGEIYKQYPYIQALNLPLQTYDSNVPHNRWK